MPTPPRTRAELARLIDHTQLKPDATQSHVERLCAECLQFGFAAACVNPLWVPLCVGRLEGSSTAVATVAGFPLGAVPARTKAFEAQQAVEQGAREIDMVVNIGALIAGDADAVRKDIMAVVAAAKGAHADAVVKVILETRALTEAQAALGCRCAVEARADYVKTSTGFHAAGGATIAHVARLRKLANPLKVKAAGGIRDLPTALAMIEAGADRLGLSASVAVIEALEGA